MLVAYVCGKEHLSNTQTVFYLDNDAARAGLMKAFSAIQHAEAIAERVTYIEADVCSKPWYGRVPTSSNVSDPFLHFQFLVTHVRGDSFIPSYLCDLKRKKYICIYIYTVHEY